MKGTKTILCAWVSGCLGSVDSMGEVIGDFLLSKSSDDVHEITERKDRESCTL